MHLLCTGSGQTTNQANAGHHIFPISLGAEISEIRWCLLAGPPCISGAVLFQSSTVKSSSLTPTSATRNENVSYFCRKILSDKSYFFFPCYKTGEILGGAENSLH